MAASGVELNCLILSTMGWMIGLLVSSAALTAWSCRETKQNAEHMWLTDGRSRLLTGRSRMPMHAVSPSCQ